MRRPFFLVAPTVAALAVLIGPAAADQTDPRLDLLFEELRTGDGGHAEENIARIIDIWSSPASDTVDLLFERAEAAADNGAPELALALLDHVVGLAPHFAQGFALRGALRLAAEDRAGALDDFSTVIELEPRHFVVRASLAELLLANGAKREAYDMFQKVLEWNPHDEHALGRARTLRRELDGQEI